ncbi:MAG: element excision factor XisI family protein [Nostocaceae cyanobacterium]|nr:element excision factor XisI family protein [Nostocaceae cyanobacterium]
MTTREQLIQELEEAPDDLVQAVLDFLHRAKAARTDHPLAKFAGILSDEEAQELKRAIADCRQVDIKDEKIWVQHDGTQDAIAEQLVALGVPKHDIVLAYHAPHVRQYTEFAVG